MNDMAPDTRGQGQDDNSGPGHQVTIIVNARPHAWREKQITFEEVVALAFPNPPTGNELAYTVTYRKGDGHHPEGTMVPGSSVKVKDGEIFNVTPTVKS